MYIKEFTLKQHTPIIHFQANDTGATLRASEVKPKLDRFIYNKWLEQENGNEEKTLKKYGCFTVGRTKEKWKKEWAKYDSLDKNKRKEYLKKFRWALNYKMKVKSKGKPEISLPLSSYYNTNIQNQIIQSKDNLHNISKVYISTPYFGNEEFINTTGKRADKRFDETKSELGKVKVGIKYNENIKINLLGCSEDLLNYLENYIVAFFLLNNFGTRQTKGFGSFTVYSINGIKVTEDVNDILRQNNVKYYLTDKNVFPRIQRTHQLLKSGININFGNRQEYEKSELFYFFANKNIRWDKRFIKMNINQNKINGKELYYENKPTDFYLTKESIETINTFTDDKRNKASYKFIRALLGLAEQYEFLINFKGRIDKKDKYIVSVKHVVDNEKPDKIERFSSPILYKVINNNIYIIPQKIPDYLFTAKFQFNIKLKSNDTVKSTKSIPVPSQFELDNFLDYAFENPIFKTQKIE